jgi:hypothetical protein
MATAKESNLTNIFWLGFVIYTTSYVVTVTGYVNFVLYQGLQIAGMVIFLFGAINIVSPKFDYENLRIKYILYCIWSVIIIIRGFTFDYNSIKYLMVDAYDGLFVYLVPFILFFTWDTAHIKKFLNVILIMGVIFFVLNIVYSQDIFFTYGRNIRSQAMAEVFSKSLSIPCGFILLTYIYHNRKRKIFALFIIILTLLIAIIRARRGLALMTFSILVAFYFIHYYLNKQNLFNLFASIVVAGLTVLFVIFTFSSSNSGAFGYFNSRTNEDTRKGVEDCLYNDMRTQDWIFGKGIHGTYFCPGVDAGFGGQVIIYRYGIETDYLNIMLKGGLIYIGLLILILLPAAIKGIFYSRNILSKASGVWILLYLKDLYPAPVTDFTLNYMLVWVSVGICYTSQIRQMTDDDIKILLKG